MGNALFSTHGLLYRGVFITLDRYESSSDRVRRSGRSERRSSKSGFATWWTAFVFGSLFVAAGLSIVLMGAKVIPVDPNGVHSPYWVLVVVGVVFASAGLMVWGMVWKQYATNRRRKEVMQSGQGDAALADYPWDPRGFAAKRWARSVKALGMAGFMTLFLVTFNYWGLWTKSPWMVKAIVILFDLILLTVWWQTCLLLGCAVKFGGSSIEYAAFPFLLPKPVFIRWQPALGINQARKGNFTFVVLKNGSKRIAAGRADPRAWCMNKLGAGLGFRIANTPSNHMKVSNCVLNPVRKRLQQICTPTVPCSGNSR